MSRRPAHRGTTAHLQAAYPFVAEGGLGSRGVYVGKELLGGSFCYDPWELYGRVLTNPNVIVAGQVGRAKSSFVKTYLWRQSVFGRRAAVLDPKGEYGPLARALGVEVVRLVPGGDVRLNPLDPGPGAGELAPEEVVRRQTAVLSGLAAAGLGRRLGPEEGAALDLALAAVGAAGRRVPTLADVVEALFAPGAAAARSVHTSAGELARDGRPVALVLRRLVEGDLAGMFDGPTSVDVDWEGPAVVLDLSALYSSEALGALMVCATAWLQAAVARPGAGKRTVVVDEAWAILSSLGTARWLRASLKLSRAYGVSNVVVVHRLSDLLAAGAEGSEQVRLAQGLLADAETRVVYGQAPGEMEAAARLLGLTNTEAEVVPQLGRGVALWKVGQRSYLVQHRLGAAEEALVDTDERMAP